MEKEDSELDQVKLIQFFTYHKETKFSINLISTRYFFQVRFEDLDRRTVRNVPNVITKSPGVRAPQVYNSTFLSYSNEGVGYTSGDVNDIWLCSDGSKIKYRCSSICRSLIELFPVDVTNVIMSYLPMKDVFNVLVFTNLQYTRISRHYSSWVEIGNLGLYYRISDVNTCFWVSMSTSKIISNANNVNGVDYVPIEVARFNGPIIDADILLVMLTIMISVKLTGNDRVKALNCLFPKSELIEILDRLRITHFLDVSEDVHNFVDCGSLAKILLKGSIISRIVYDLQEAYVRAGDKILAKYVNDRDPVTITESFLNKIYMSDLFDMIVVAKGQMNQDYYEGGMHTIYGISSPPYYNGIVCTVQGQVLALHTNTRIPVKEKQMSIDLNKLLDITDEQEKEKEQDSESNGSNSSHEMIMDDS